MILRNTCDFMSKNNNDVFEKTEHKLFLGDCLEVMSKFKDNTIDLVFADPPYNISKTKGLAWAYSSHVTMQEKWDMFSKDEFFSFNVAWIKKCIKLLKDGGSFWVSGSFHNIYQIGFILTYLEGIKILNSIVWFKPNAQPNISCRMFTESTEHLIWACKESKKVKWTFNYDDAKKSIHDKYNPLNKQTRNLWIIPVTPQREKTFGEHPTQKPTELLRRIIISSSNNGDTILDPFAGTGTTNYVAFENSRNSIGIEKKKAYYNIAKNRLQHTIDNSLLNGELLLYK